MKKTILFAALLLAAVAPLWGQEWRFRTIEADELRGTEADSVATYVTERYSVLVSFTNGNLFVQSKDCVFDYHKNEYWVLVGIYDGEGNMQSRDRIFCYYPNTGSLTLIKIVNARHLRKNHPGDTIATRIIERLNSGEGYVRIIAPMYQCNELDTTLPPF